MRKLPLKFIETSSFGSCRIALYKVVFRDDGFLSHVLAGIDQVLSTFGILLLTPLILSQILIMIFMSCCSLHLSVFLSVQNMTLAGGLHLQAVLDGVDMLSISLGSISSVTGAPCLNTFDIAQLLAVKEKTYVYTCTTNTPDMALA
jgi:hypothetical protein